MGIADRHVFKHLNSGLEKANASYLDSSLTKALVGFGTMSAIKAGLDVIEGTTVGAEVGVTASVQVGDVVKPAYDYVDIAWRTLLTSCVMLLSLKYLLQVAGMIGGFTLGCSLFIAALLLTLRWFRPNLVRVRSILRDLLSFTVIISFALYYILPLSVWGASKLSQTITRPSIEEAQRGFEGAKNALFPEEQGSTNRGVLAKIKQIPEQLERVVVSVKAATKDMVLWAIKLITGYLFDCIVFPIALFLMLLSASRAVLRYCFQRNVQRSMRDDLARVLVADRRARFTHTTQ